MARSVRKRDKEEQPGFAVLRSVGRMLISKMLFSVQSAPLIHHEFCYTGTLGQILKYLRTNIGILSSGINTQER